MADGNDTYRVVEIEIPLGVSKERLDRYLARDSGLDITRSRVQKLIDEGLILVNGKPACIIIN